MSILSRCVRRFLPIAFVACTHLGESATAPNPGTPWPATDALSRSMPDTAAVPAPRSDRFVGIFYFLWNNRDSERLPNDLAKILPQDPDLLKKPNSPLWGKPGMYYWGEPLYGYYNSRDPWVLRRHAMLLTDAGVDGQATWLEKNTGGWKWEKLARVELVTIGNELMLAVPRQALSLPPGDAVQLDFKWWDNAQKPGDIMDTYLSGDCAPEARFNYRFASTPAPR